jgi:toxin ParE1/3/4
LKPLRIIDLAEAEYRDAARWYRERNPRVAGRFAAETRRALALIEEFHLIGGVVPGVPDEHVRRMPVHTFPYHVVFVDLGDRIEVVAFAHNRRRPAYFLTRLQKS